MARVKTFFPESRDLQSSISDLYGFVWPATAALWTLRWQLVGFLNEVEDATENDIANRFLTGSGIRYGGLGRWTKDYSWPDQQERFAEMLLINAIALYEGWVSQLVGGTFGANTSTQAALMFPSRGIGGQRNRGIRDAISELKRQGGHSATLEESYGQRLRAKRKYAWANLDNLLICFRYFKEARNCLVHRHGTIDNRVEAASRSYEKLTLKDLGLRERPVFHPSRSGDRLRLDLRGIVGFVDVILRIVVTVDAQLCSTMVAERLLVSDLRREYGPRIDASQARSAERLLQFRITKLGYPEPKATDALFALTSTHKQ